MLENVFLQMDAVVEGGSGEKTPNMLEIVHSDYWILSVAVIFCRHQK